MYSFKRENKNNKKCKLPPVITLKNPYFLFDKFACFGINYYALVKCIHIVKKCSLKVVLFYHV